MKMKNTVEPLPADRERDSAIQAIVLDLGRVLFRWGGGARQAGTAPEAIDLGRILRHPTWSEFERGQIDEALAFAQLSARTGVPQDDLRGALHAAFETLRLDEHVLKFARAQRKSGKRIICLSNTPRPFVERMFARFDIWDIFDWICMTSLLGISKPDERVFQYVLMHENLAPDRLVLVDDDPDNTEAATRQGLHVILYRPGCDLTTELDKMDAAPSRSGPGISTTKAGSDHGLLNHDRAMSYLTNSLARNGLCPSFYSHDIGMSEPREFSREVFSTLMVVQALDELPMACKGRLMERIREFSTNGLYCFFSEPDPECFESGKDSFPCDVDTTSIASSILVEQGMARRDDVTMALTRMVENVDDDGVIQVYFDSDRPRLEPVVCVNALRFLFLLGVDGGRTIENTLAYVLEFLASGAWRGGTRYYPSPDAFLYFLAKLVGRFPARASCFAPGLRSALVSRVGCNSHCIEQAMRVTACGQLGLANRIDQLRVARAQQSDGAWPSNGLFLAAKTKRWFGSRELTTALALEANRTAMRRSQR